MKFWDSSAIVPLLVEEEHSPACRSLFRSDPDMAVWQLTLTEATSALSREWHADRLDDAAFQQAERKLTRIASRWRELRALDDAALDALRAEARRILRAHPLRAADALQLAAACLFFEHPMKHGFVVLDAALARAAEAEGFTVLAPAKGGRRKSS